MLTIDCTYKVPLGAFNQNRTTSAAGGACSVVLAAPTDTFRHLIHYIQWSYSTTPTGGRLTVTKEDTTVILDLDITVGGPGGYNLLLKGDVADSVTIALAAPGGAVVGKLNVQSSESAA